MTLYIIISVVCLILSAVFSASEMAISSANRMRLESLAEDGSKSAKTAINVLDRFDNALSAILVGNNFVNIGLSSAASLIAIVGFGEEYTWLSTVIVTIAVIICGETIPKITAKRNATRWVCGLSSFIRALSILLFPVVKVTCFLTDAITGRMKGEAPDEEAAVEELQCIIETAEDEDVLDEDQSELMQAALDFDDVSVSEVMTSRVDMEAIDISDELDEIIETITDSTYSRLPVFEDSPDNIIGVLYLNKFYRAMLSGNIGKNELRGMLMKPCYVYKTLRLPSVLEEMRRQRQHLAIVTDEYGGTLGVVSMEDVLEEIVGEIYDETDEIEPEVIERSGKFELDGDMVISDFLELIGRDEDSFETESATVGGWTIEKFEGFPHSGDSFTDDGIKITVLKMDGLRVDKLLVELTDTSDALKTN